MGKCDKCLGKGDIYNGWSLVDGERRRECAKCNGTGTLPDIYCIECDTILNCDESYYWICENEKCSRYGLMTSKGNIKK